jgi:glycosyltransferase involved in cell wall biosynthesis
MATVFHVITGLEQGGAEKLLTDLAIAAKGRNEDWTVITLLDGGPFRATLAEAGVPVVSLGMRRKRPSLKGLLYLRKIIRREQPEIIMGWMYHANLIALLALWLSGRRHLTRLYWSVYCSALRFSDYHWSLYLVFRLGAWFSAFTDGIIYNSYSGQKSHVSAGYRSAGNFLIHNGTDTTRFRPDPFRRSVYRAQLGIPENTFVVIAVARLDPMKDWDTLLAATDRLSGVVTLFVGAGTQAFSRPDRIGLGFQRDLAGLYNVADLFILTSAYGEGSSIALIEAMASGLPVITTDVGDNDRIAAGCGQVVKVGNREALRAAILTLQSDVLARERLGTRARQVAVQRFSITNAYASLASILK